MSAKKDNGNQITLESVGVELPRPDDIVLYKSKTKQADKITVQDIIEEFDEVKDLALNAGRPNFSAAATLAIAKAKVLGFMAVKKTEVTINNPVVKLQELTDEQLLEIASR